MELNMFDSLLFEAKLPKDGLPEFIQEQDLSMLEFQTTDLNRAMDTWSVSTAGKLYMHETESRFMKNEDHPEGGFFKDIPLGIKHIEETQSIHFYRVFEQQDKDWWVSYDALFRKGELVSVDLHNSEEVPKESRERAHQELNKAMEQAKRQAQSKTRVILKPIKFLLGVSLLCLHTVGRNLAKMHSKL